MNLTLHRDALNKLGSFYLLLRQDLKVIDCGDGLKKMCNEIAIGDSFETYFEIEKNAQVFKNAEFLIKEGLLYFLIIRESGIKLKGQFIKANKDDYLLICTPLIADMKNLSSLSLNFLDFPLHDYFTDAMFLLRANEKTMVEVKEYGEKIKERNQELRLKNKELNEAQTLLQKSNDDLEIRVKNRTRELQTINDELSSTISTLQQTQTRLIESAKLAALGQLVAGIAHEINTPIGAIKASVELLQQLMKQGFSTAEEIHGLLSSDEKVLFYDLISAIFETENLYSSREQRKMSRELKDKLRDAGIEKCAEVAMMMGDIGYFEDLSSYYPLFQHNRAEVIIGAIHDYAVQDRMSAVIKTSISKADRVVTALKAYMEEDLNSERTDVDVITSLESVLVLNKNLIKQGVNVIRSYSAEKMTLKCSSNGLNQVWINLIHNALQAMENKGTLRISASHFDDLLFVCIEDDGPGIPKNIKDSIFDPFFTTKKSGQGTGLGLNLVRKIIRQLSGEINVESEPGKTTFTITLPGVTVEDAKPELFEAEPMIKI